MTKITWADVLATDFKACCSKKTKSDQQTDLRIKDERKPNATPQPV